MWSARWCSEDELKATQKFTVVFGEATPGVSEATCLIDTGCTTIGLKLSACAYRGALHGFIDLRAGLGMIVIYSGMAVVLDRANGKFRCNKVNMYPCIGALSATNAVILYSYSDISIIKTAADITLARFDGEIEGVQLDENYQSVIIDVNEPGAGRKQVRQSI
jgi:hypothetical protein